MGNDTLHSQALNILVLASPEEHVLKFGNDLNMLCCSLGLFRKV